MRIATFTLALIAFSLFVPEAASKHDPTAWDGRSLVAHEWGTFTTLQGSNGVVLEGLRHEEQDLPSFVHDLRDYTGVTGVSPKMETPVIYFYSPKERKVHVRVKFPRGVVTQWYPAAFRVNHMGRMTNGAPSRASGAAIETLKDGYIDWGNWSDLTILAPGAKSALPSVADDDPWRFCRDVGANTLRTCNLNLARKRAGPGKRVREVVYEHEKCLFYRGLGNFALPLRGRVLSEHATDNEYAVSVKLDNHDPKEPLTHLFLIWVKDGRCGWKYVPELKGGRQIDARLALTPVGDATEKLVHALSTQLTKTGLFRREAVAMARTWQQGYFQDEGLRVLYVLPKAFIDRELPLELEHMRAAKNDRPPFQVVRTFVGRTELLSPERERHMEEVVHDFARGDAIARGAAEKRLVQWGRFAIPYLNRVLAMTDDAAVRRIVHARLGELRLVR